MARYHEDQWPAYVPVAERRRKAERAAGKLTKKGAALSPVIVEGRKIAATFWGKAWCDNLESYRDYENRLERGRSYVRNGLVIDLRIAPHAVTAMVSGSSVYTVKITINEVAKTQWKAICADCAGGIDSLVELLQGRFSKAVMERICRQGTGLFPKPSEIAFSCTCLDHASMCKHVAATLYGVGARLDLSPELLFRLRGVNENDLVADVGNVLPMASTRAATGNVLQDDDVAALFGLDMAEPDETRPSTQAKQALTSKPKTRQPASKPVAAKSLATKSRVSPAKPASKSSAQATTATSRQARKVQVPAPATKKTKSAGRDARS